ncbi:MAG: hypothetical protein WED04_06205 [Promethearchaeati archaeon SRVP18_Atabeyarchaeia-1]
MIPDYLIDIRSKYIPKGVSMIRYNDFTNNIERYIKQLVNKTNIDNSAIH